jgi:hypothetical protein
LPPSALHCASQKIALRAKLKLVHPALFTCVLIENREMHNERRP